jgi:hypothetical protein
MKNQATSSVLRASIIGLVLAELSACGGTSSSGVTPTVGVASQAVRESKSPGLLYVVTTAGIVDILTYPGLKNIGTLEEAKATSTPVTSNPNNGNILINIEGVVCEFKHGGQKPIAKIQAPESYGSPAAYAFDPTTQNIAIGYQTPSESGSVAIYQSPSSTPTLYTVPHMDYPGYMGYDAAGDLFVEGGNPGAHQYAFAELPKGGSAFQDIALSQTLTEPGTVQWDGSHITIANGNSIWQIQVSGSEGTVVAQSTLSGAWAKQPTFWIQGATILGDLLSNRHTHNGRFLGLWNYPQGGRAYKTVDDLSKNKKDRIVSETVSVTP